MRIALVAGEASGDILGADLMLELKQQYGQAIEFEGIGGEKMQAQGLRSLYPMEWLSLMGLFEIIPSLFKLLKLRRQLVLRWRNNPPDLLIGIDAPDFNLSLEKQCHAAGVTCIHYVSPSVWAWRQNRVKKIKGHLDLILTLFPHERAFYQAHDIPCAFVGHTLADQIAVDPTPPSTARKALGLAEEYTVALMPGSRTNEISRLAPVFLQAAELIRQQQHAHKQLPWQWLCPVLDEQAKQRIEAIKHQLNINISLRYIIADSHQAMQAADQLMMFSGTATLEGLLFKRPMQAAAIISPITAWVIQRFKLLKSRYITLPNILADQALIKESIQNNATPETIADEALRLAQMSPDEQQKLMKNYTDIHLLLKQNASYNAAKHCLTLVATR